LSELVKWFEKRTETRALSTIQRHLCITIDIVEDLEKAIAAAVANNEQQMWKFIERVAINEEEADSLRRRVMDEISKGELSPDAREDLLDLVKKVDMVADWSRESTRILGAIPMDQAPISLKNEMLEMVKGSRQCSKLLQICVNRMMTKPEEALQAADQVEREEENVDETHEKTRILIGKEDLPRAGVAVLINELFETLEMIADSCEDACDQVRIIMVRK